MCLCGESAFAHPVPKTNHDRIIDIHLTRDGVTVDYSLEVAPETAALELTREEIAQLADYKDFYPAYLKHQKAALADNLDAKLDGKPLAFTCVRSHFDDPHQHLHLPLHGPVGAGTRPAASFLLLRCELRARTTSACLRLTLTADDSVTLEQRRRAGRGADGEAGRRTQARRRRTAPHGVKADVRVGGTAAEAAAGADRGRHRAAAAPPGRPTRC